MPDILEREPDFDFAQYMEWCKRVDLKVRWAEIDFLQWLYSENNTREHRGLS
jgi:hypothetical protein